MRAYAIRRLLLVIPTLFLATVIIFLLLRLMPGDIVDAMIVEMEEAFGGTEGVAEAQMRAALEEELGLNVPVPVQYGRWMGIIPRENGSFSGILQGNLGNSMWYKKPVAEMIMPRLPVTLELSLMSIILSYLVAIPVGIYAAVRQDTWGDYLGRSFAIGWLSIPNFWLATMVMVFPAIW
ncbi:MAG: glutathione ABC transporter permease GsiC, partial [Dehalococcoidia bacterium]|nr:glutathione ABC transporter permease GsiC [Dehalococcoidia bacterium]